MDTSNKPLGNILADWLYDNYTIGNDYQIVKPQQKWEELDKREKDSFITMVITCMYVLLASYQCNALKDQFLQDNDPMRKISPELDDILRLIVIGYIKLQMLHIRDTGKSFYEYK